MVYSHDSVYLLSQPSLWFLCSLGKGSKLSASLQIHGRAFIGSSIQIYLPTLFSGWCPTPGQVSCMSWLTSGTLQELDSMVLEGPSKLRIFSDSVIAIKPSSLTSATLAQQREHKHADKGRGWHCPCSWQLAIGAIYLYYPNMSFSVLS